MGKAIHEHARGADDQVVFVRGQLAALHMQAEPVGRFKDQGVVQRNRLHDHVEQVIAVIPNPGDL